MSRESVRERLSKAKPGPWERVTQGHSGLASQVSEVAYALESTNRWAFPEERYLMTDLTWVDGPNGSHVVLVGNGPKQTEHGDFIAAARQDIPALLAVADAAAAVVAAEDMEGDNNREVFTTWKELRAALAALEALP